MNNIFAFNGHAPGRQRGVECLAVGISICSSYCFLETLNPLRLCIFICNRKIKVISKPAVRWRESRETMYRKIPAERHVRNDTSYILGVFPFKDFPVISLNHSFQMELEGKNDYKFNNS